MSAMSAALYDTEPLRYETILACLSAAIHFNLQEAYYGAVLKPTG